MMLIKSEPKPHRYYGARFKFYLEPIVIKQVEGRNIEFKTQEYGQAIRFLFKNLPNITLKGALIKSIYNPGTKMLLLIAVGVAYNNSNCDLVNDIIVLQIPPKNDIQRIHQAGKHRQLYFFKSPS